MDDERQSAQAIRQTLTKLKQLLARESPPKLSEADTKAEFIERYIGALGYEGLEEVQREYYVKNSQEFIDYVLRVGGAPVLAIEAKPLQTDLTDKHAAQLVQYCAVEGIEWCILTNARALWLFNTYLKGDQNQKLVVKLDLLGFNTDAEFQAIFDQVWLLSKTSLSSPSAINSWMEQRRLDQAMRMILLNQHSESIKALVAELTRVAGVAASADGVVRWVRDRLTPSISAVPAPDNVTPIRESESTRTPLGPAQYWLVPCGESEDRAPPLEHLHRWLDRGFWGFYASTPGRQHLQPGDFIAFYANKVGVVAKARVTGRANLLVGAAEWPEPTPPTKDVYKIPIQDVVWLLNPHPINKKTWDLYSGLDAFRGRNADANPGWFVTTTHQLSQHDFDLLTSGGAA